MFEIIACDEQRVTLKWKGEEIDPDPASTITLRIDNSDNFFKVGDRINLRLLKVESVFT